MSESLIGLRLDEALEKLSDGNYTIRHTDPPGGSACAGTLRIAAVRNNELVVSFFCDNIKEEKHDKNFEASLSGQKA